MKSKLLFSVATGLLVCGCSNSAVEQEQYDNLVKSEILYMIYANGEKDIASLNHVHTMKVLNEDGVDRELDTIVPPDSEKVKSLCKINLLESDIHNKHNIVNRTLGFEDYEIINSDKLNNLNKCVNNYLKTTAVDNLSSQYLFGDERISDNIHYDFLKKSMTDAVKDDKVTYSEMYNIYRNLDKALKLNVQKNVEEKTKKAKDLSKSESIKI